MDLTDYETPDPYAPRAKASQTVAAQKRAAQPGRPAHDTEPITPLKLSRRYLPFGIGALVLILLMIGAASYQLAQLGSARPLAVTPGPSTAAFLAAPTPLPAPSTATEAPERTINAYAAPAGALLGPVELTRIPVIPVAHYGTDWVQYDVTGSGRVWFRRSDVNAVLAGPDLAPVAAQPQTGRGLTVDTSGQGGWTPPGATDAPGAPPTEPTATPIVWPTSAPAVPADFKKPDINQTCQFVGCLGAKAVDQARAQACHALFWQYGDADPETIAEPDLSAVRGCIWEGLYR